MTIAIARRIAPQLPATIAVAVGAILEQTRPNHQRSMFQTKADVHAALRGMDLHTAIATIVEDTRRMNRRIDALLRSTRRAIRVHDREVRSC